MPRRRHKMSIGNRCWFAPVVLLLWGQETQAFSPSSSVDRSAKLQSRGRDLPLWNIDNLLPHRKEIILLRAKSNGENNVNGAASNEEEIIVHSHDADNSNVDEKEGEIPTQFFVKEESQAAALTLEPSASINYDAAYVLFSSAIIGIVSGFFVALFKLSIESLREFLYGTSLLEHFPIFLIPALGGLGVGILAAFGKFSPGLLGTANEIDSISLNTMRDERFSDVSRFLRKPLAAIFTLGSGCSLGPEGPSVELGMSVSRICMPPTPRGRSETEEETIARIRRNRLLLSAGAAAGVAAGFNAPLAGVFFALEIVQQNQPTIAPPSSLSPVGVGTEVQSPKKEKQWFLPAQQDFLSGSGSITAILLASVLSALVSQVYLGDSLALSVPSYELKTPLVELPLYLLLGVVSGVVAATFTALAQFSKAIFDGDAGPALLRRGMKIFPKWTKPVMGGLICGVVGLVYPQILFFGYDTLNALLGKNSVPTGLVTALLVVKTFTTAISAGSGLVGGTFAPSLFLGGMVGASFHNIMAQMFVLAHGAFEMADVQAYAIVGAAGVLAALFRAPLTASLLLFELTRDYEVLLPVVASAGVGSLIGDIVENIFEEKRRDRDAVSWGDLADDEDEIQQGKNAA